MMIPGALAAIDLPSYLPPDGSLYSNTTTFDGCDQGGCLQINLGYLRQFFVAVTGANVTGMWDFENGTLHVNSTSDRVGIGTTNPNQKLTVVGDTNITGELRLGGVSTDGANRLVCIKADGTIGTTTCLIQALTLVCGTCS